ncbi:MAG: hypothetical protein P1P84_04980 [Deferrisomatales bacterium]|nr:hypothetical protein [Deferrisomatales bacterium]
MKQCADCRRRGLLLRLDSLGRCEDCARRLEQRIDSRVSKIRGALAAVEASRDVDWIVEELGRVEIQCRVLARQERSVQGRTSPRTEVLLRTVAERRDRVLNRWAETVEGAALRQVGRLAFRDQKEVLLREALERLRQYEDKLTDGQGYRASQRELSSLLVCVQAEASGETGRCEAPAPGRPALQLVGVAVAGKAGAPGGSPVVAEPHPADRRRFSRRRSQFQVTLSPGGDRCLAEDFSSRGILLRSPEEQRVGDFLDLQLHTAKGCYRTTGIVVWTGIAGGAPPLPNTLGVAFTGGVPVAAA